MGFIKTKQEKAGASVEEVGARHFTKEDHWWFFRVAVLALLCLANFFLFGIFLASMMSM